MRAVGLEETHRANVEFRDELTAEIIENDKLRASASEMSQEGGQIGAAGEDLGIAAARALSGGIRSAATVC